MKPSVSKKAVYFKRSKSPIREIMSYADPQYIKGIGLNPSDIISFAGGWVAHTSPVGLQEAYQEIISKNKLFHSSGAYSPTLGTIECRKALAEFESYLYGMEDIDAEHIAIGVNSTHLIFTLFQVLLDPGDSVLLLDPTYCNYPMQLITTMNLRILRFPVLDPISWKYVADEIIEQFSNFILENKPKVILLVSPDNPTSQILSDKFVKITLDSAKEVGSFVVIDFAYKEIVFDGSYPGYYSWPPNDNFITIHSNSKWCRSLGRRLGWVEAPDFVIEAMEPFLNSSILCPDMLHQMALTRHIRKAIAEDSLKSYIEETSQKYRSAAEHTVLSIKKYLGFPCLDPEGGLYTCIKVNMDGAKFVEDVLKNTGVLFVPGWGFGRTLYNAVRVSFGPLVNNLEMISEGIEKVGRYLGK